MPVRNTDCWQQEREAKELALDGMSLERLVNSLEIGE